MTTLDLIQAAKLLGPWELRGDCVRQLGTNNCPIDAVCNARSIPRGKGRWWNLDLAPLDAEAIMFAADGYTAPMSATPEIKILRAFMLLELGLSTSPTGETTGGVL